MRSRTITRLALAFFTLVATTVLPNGVSAQDGLNAVLKTTTSTKPTLVVFDVRPATVSLEAIHEAILGAFRVHYDGLKAHQELAPYPLPLTAPRIKLVRQASAFGDMNTPVCDGATSQVTARELSAARFGEVSVIQACAFPYRDGVRVNFYAAYIQTSGGRTSLDVMSGAIG